MKIPAEKNLNEGGLSSYYLGRLIKYGESNADFLKKLSEEQVLRVLDAMQESPRMERLYFRQCDITKAVALRMAEVIRSHPTLNEVNLFDTGLSEKNARIIAEAVNQNPNIREMTAACNKLGEEHKGFDAIAEVLAGNRNLASCTFSYVTPVGTDITSIVEAFSGSKNIMYCNPDADSMKEQCEDNKNAANDLVVKVRAGIAQLSVADIFAIDQRRNAVLKQMGVKFVNRGEGRREIKRLSNFLTALPVVEINDALEPEDLVQPNDEGFTPLDNPETWRQLPAISEQLVKNNRPLPLELLNGNNRDGESYLTGGILCDSKNSMQALNQQGIFIRGKMLLENGTASPLLESLIRNESLACIFTQDNWQGASSQELQAVLRVVPPESKKQVPNLHSLQASLKTEQNGMGR